MKRFVFLSCLFILLCTGAESPGQDNGPKFTPLFDLRVRQEVLDGVMYFAPDPDREWVRFRTRAGLKSDFQQHSLTFRLVNEHRRFVVPAPSEFDWGELIIDQAKWDWKPEDETTLTLGRQNIIWDDGFLVLEGHPLDGSRSIYMDGVRLRTTWSGEKLDLFAVHNKKRDPYVLAGDENKALSDTDETGVGAKITLGSHRLAAIWKQDDDPDGTIPLLNTYTLDGRFLWGSKEITSYTFETAVQYHDGIPEGAADGPTTSGFDFAVQGQAKGNLSGPVDADLGFFFYGKNFRTPWGRWPKWSELYIYTLLGEGGDGRVHVAAWENIAAPRLNLHYPISDMFRARWGLAYLLAPEPDWQARGLLMQTELKFDLVKGLDGHLLWEMLDPGSFHDHAGGMDKPVHFLRWQIVYAFK
jgi:hypothetical protein